VATILIIFLSQWRGFEPPKPPLWLRHCRTKLINVNTVAKRAVSKAVSGHSTPDAMEIREDEDGLPGSLDEILDTPLIR